MHTEQDQMAQAIVIRDRIAERIKMLSQKWSENTLAIGQEFLRARDSFPANSHGHRPGWHDWIRTNTDWQPHWATRFVRIAENSGRWISKSSSLTTTVLDFLSRPDVPKKGALEVIERAQTGESVNLDKAKKIIAKHLPTRAQAIEQAERTGKLVAARDGKLYSGASEDEMAAYSDRREAVYSVRRAVKAIADCGFNPADWVKAAEDHWLTEFSLGDIDSAIKWLTKVKPLVEKRQRVINADA